MEEIKFNAVKLFRFGRKPQRFQDSVREETKAYFKEVKTLKRV